MDKNHGCVPRQPAQNWGLTKKKNLSILNDLRSQLSADVSTYKASFDRDYNYEDVDSYLAWLGSPLYDEEGNEISNPEIKTEGNPLFGNKTVGCVAPELEIEVDEGLVQNVMLELK